MTDDNTNKHIQESLTAQLQLFEKLLKITERQQGFLNNHDIEHALKCLDDREKIIEKIKALKKKAINFGEIKEGTYKSLFDEINYVIQLILDIDRHNQNLIETEKSAIATKICAVTHGRKLTNAYSPFKSVDAIFFDKKK